jgi:hypothetical protein
MCHKREHDIDHVTPYPCVELRGTRAVTDIRPSWDPTLRHGPGRGTRIGPVTDRPQSVWARVPPSRPAPGRTAPVVARPVGPDDQWQERCRSAPRSP